MSAVFALPQVKDFLKTLAKGKEKGQDQGKEHDVNAHAVTEEGEPSKKPWDEDIPELSSPSYSPPTSFSYSSDSSSSSNPRRRNLPRTQNRNDAIWTIVDRFSKQAHFIPVKKTIKADHMARIFLAQIFRHHGMPKTIISDQDPRMTSNFWRALFVNLGTRLDFSSAYHPETDGQSEIVNSTVLDLLKCYVSDKQTEWEKYLPLVEFAYNNTIHSSTGKAPFEVIYGKPHLPPILLTKDKIFAADEFVQNIEAAYSQVRRAITRSQEKQKKAADKHRRRLVLQLGQYVLLKFPKARLKKQRQAKGKVVKLLTRYYEPFKIIDKINDVTFRLDLPYTWNIHNVFHISLLRIYQGNLPPELPSPEPPEVEDQEEILVPE
ncbi:hypothetical protein L7F22_040683 [Adiantum nelumboides]|nr:hypothetical protein [Adiantum nelumboides]